MIDAPRMLLIGFAGKHSGKNDFGCSLIEEFRGSREIVAAKVTTVKDIEESCARSCEGCDICIARNTHFLISREVDAGRGKDTERMVAAGASSVYWLRVSPEHLREGARVLLDEIGKEAFVICQSNRLRSVVNPGVFLMLRHQEGRFSHSAEAVRAQVDRLVTFTGDRFDLDLDDIDLLESGWALRSDAAAIILAGGMSRRMLSDKSMLPIDGTPMVKHIHGQLLPHFKQILVSANDVEKFAFMGARVVPDSVAGHGPLMGITSALKVSEYDLNFVTACDMPTVNMALVRRMLRETEGFDGVAPIDEGRLEPLFAVYRKSLVGVFQEALEQDNRRIRDAFDKCNIKYLDISEDTPLTNLNTPEDYDGFISRTLE